MSRTRRFDLGDILSVTGSHLVSPRGMEGVHDILGFMTGRQLYTHQLPRAFEVCERALLARYPQLATVDESECTPSTWRAWLSGQKDRLGDTLEVEALPPYAVALPEPEDTCRRTVH